MISNLRLYFHLVFKGMDYSTVHHACTSTYHNYSLYSYVTSKNHLGCQWTQENKCGLMEGPCIDDSNCLFDLICEANSCDGDFPNGTRCCTQPLSCNHNHTRTDTCCNNLHQCDVNEGNCENNDDCYGNLQCGIKNCDWDNFTQVNCCTHPPNEGGK